MKPFAITFALLISSLALAGCATDEVSTTTRERGWDDVEPALRASCAGCHDGSGAAPGFLAGTTGDEVRTTLLGSSYVDRTTPSRSPLLTKGVHEGPALSSTETALLVTWIESERDRP